MSRSDGSVVDSATRTALPRRDVGVLVVRHEYADRAGQVGRPVLRLPVGAHHPVVAADAVVVLGRDAAGEVERLLAGEHHRALRGHHQDALGVHQHRGLGVPVRLRADVDARDHDVDLAAVLGELHDPAQRLGHPVHVLGAGVHRDARAGGEREPLHGYAETLGQVERRDDAQALLLGDRAQRLRRVAAEHHALHALGVQRRRRGHDGGEDAGRVEAVGPVDGHELPRRVEVVLDERATRTGQHAAQLVGVDEATAARSHHLRGVVVQGSQQILRRLLDRGDHAGSRLGAEAHGHRQRLAAGDGQTALGHDLLDAGAVGQRADLGAECAERVEVEVDDGPDGDPDVVHVELGAGRATGHPLAADRLQAVLHRALGVRQPGDGAVLVAYDGHLAHLRKGHQPPVRGVLPGDAVVEQHVAGRVDAGDVEVAQPPQVEATADHRVHAASQVVLDDGAVSGRTEDEVADLAVAASRAHRNAHASYVVGERQSGQTCSELGAHLVRRRRGVGPGEVEVDDGVLARRARQRRTTPPR